MSIKITISRDKRPFFITNKKTKYAFLISLVYTLIVALLSIQKHNEYLFNGYYLWIPYNFRAIWVVLVSVLFFSLLQTTSYVLSRKYFILDKLWGGKYSGIYFLILKFSLGVVATTYLLILAPKEVMI